jgi:hypothetical protein
MRVLEQIPKIVAKIASATSRHILRVAQGTAESNERPGGPAESLPKDMKSVGEGENGGPSAKRMQPAVWPI